MLAMSVPTGCDLLPTNGTPDQSNFPSDAPHSESQGSLSSATGASRYDDWTDKLYPLSPVNWDSLTQYPGMSYTEIYGYSSEAYFGFEFETNDEPAAVEAFYQGRVDNLGWRQVPPAKGWTIRPRYYLGDYGQDHVYGYYLSFWAVDGGQYLRTYARVEIERTLPVYLGAENVVMDEYHGFDSGWESVEFDTRDEPLSVQQFYKILLAKDGWKVTSSGSELIWMQPSSAKGLPAPLCDGISLQVSRANEERTHGRLWCQR